MYYLLMEHHITPGAYYKMSAGEKFLLRVFMQKHLSARSGRA